MLLAGVPQRVVLLCNNVCYWLFTCVVPLVPSLLTRQYCHQLTSKDHLLTTTTFCATFKKVCHSVLFVCVRMQSGAYSVVRVEVIFAWSTNILSATIKISPQYHDYYVTKELLTSSLFLLNIGKCQCYDVISPNQFKNQLDRM